MPNFSVLLLLTWCQQHCQIKSKTRYISFFLCDGWLFWRLFVGQCYLRSSFCLEMRFSPEGHSRTYVDAEFHNTMPFSSTTMIPTSSTTCTTYRDAGFLICKMVLSFLFLSRLEKCHLERWIILLFCVERERALQQLNYMSSISKALLHCIHLIANYISLQPPFLAIWSLPKKLFD